MSYIGGGGGGGGLTIGTTTITGGTNQRVLFDNAGVVGETTGLTTDGTNVTLSAGTGSVTVGAGSAATPLLSIGNATTGSFSVSTTGLGLSVNGVSKLDYGISSSGVWTSPVGFLFPDGTHTAPAIAYTANSNTGFYRAGTNTLGFATGTVAQAILDTSGFQVVNGSRYGWSNSSTDANSGLDTQIYRPASNFFAFSDNPGTNIFRLGCIGANAMQMGLPDAAAPSPQSIKFQSVVAGTLDTAGQNFTLKGSVGTGGGAGGQIILQTAPAGASGTSQNALATALTLTAPAVNMQPSVVVGNQALATTATDGFLYITTGAGAPTGVPTAFAGRVPMYYDTTNNFLYFNNGGWKKSTVYA